MGNARNRQRGSDRIAGSRSELLDSVRLRTADGTGDAGTGRAICWYSNAPFTATGYGQQTAQIVPRLNAAGHKTAVAANYGIEGAPTQWHGIEIYPKGLSNYSDDVLTAHYLEWAHRNPNHKPLLATLYDVWVFKSPALDSVPSIMSWVPVDHTPAPPDVLAWCQRKNVTTVAMSRFGQTMFHKAGVDALYAPHGIEKVFKPTKDIQGVTGRKIMGVPEDAFVVMMNSANKGNNPPRKAFGENLLGFAMFAKNHPDAYLYLHCEQQGAMGVNLPALAKACGIPDDRIVFADQYAVRNGVPQEVLPVLYSAADVLLACSFGEGFGIPVVEAQACGTRCITTGDTAQKELNGHGWTVETQPFWDVSQKAWFHIPLIRDITAALEMAYNDRKTVCEDSITFASQYDADHVFRTYWEPIMAVVP